jgi:hypothetical protein
VSECGSRAVTSRRYARSESKTANGRFVLNNTSFRGTVANIAVRYGLRHAT